MSDDDAQADTIDLFREPDDFYEPEKPPSFIQYTLSDGRQLELRLVGHSPLWGHLLWNAGQVVSQYLEKHALKHVRSRNVLELGAGAGLPSLTCALLGARRVVVTDYPDADLIENLKYNVQNCSILKDKDTMVVQGYLWGARPQDLLSSLQQEQQFDLVIMADILFNHSEHDKLVSTLQQTMQKNATSTALVFFTPYRPWLLDKDMAFFELARGAGFSVVKVVEHVMDDVMFQNDPGDETLRRTVFGYEMRWSHSSLTTNSLDRPTVHN